MYAYEKIGGRVKDERQMDEFRRVLEECDLVDMGFHGQKFTWERGNFADTNIRERLDRGLANLEWLNLFNDYFVQNLPHSFSDHCPILIKITPKMKHFGNHFFRFESWWITESSCDELIKEVWTKTSGNVPEKLEHIQVGLQR
ncbi:uncharacterized protein LOC108475324 [Gossypium arboreum]|uniref:uncharacterized protein LOC108475324 n=1 Tax=Gossypium arboreum TaxID=29729 RepID=UPI00081952DB|nr:uncharacterized protein LOC108475324 [Gossypium arboreum]